MIIKQMTIEFLRIKIYYPKEKNTSWNLKLFRIGEIMHTEPVTYKRICIF